MPSKQVEDVYNAGGFDGGPLGRPGRKRTDTAKLDVPKDAAVRSMCQELWKMREGLATMGLHAHILDRVSDKLNAQALEIERYRSDRAYVLGHNDGWDAAMATGLPQDGADGD